MTRKLIISAFFLVLVSFSSNAFRQDRETAFSAIGGQFADPDAQFRPMPLWIWNTDVTEADIDADLQALKDQGFGGAFIHPRPGMVTEYLSDEWFALWRYAFDKGRELGLEIWVYDENSYPSGFAGGHVQREMPESYNEGQALGGRRETFAPDSCYLCLKREGDSFKDVTSKLSEYRGVEGDYYVYDILCNPSSPWTAGMPYVDLLHKGVTRKFIDITMKGYRKALGREFGRTMKGTFTDEPQLKPPAHVRWTPDLFREFKKTRGYDLKTSWPLLGMEEGNWKKVRHDYNATLLRMFIDRWSKPWHRYTERHHLLWTGHYWEHAWPNLTWGPDNMAMYAWHQLPAIDMLFNNYDNTSTGAQFGNVRSVKELSSVANQLDRPRTLCETYGGGGWEETFQDFKRLGDWEYALGVNMMNQHLVHMTITGTRKYDYPDVFSPIEPWWEQYGTMNDYFARLSMVLSQGRQENDILILEPTTSVWMYFTTATKNRRYNEIGNAFQAFVTGLEKQQLEYDLGCEDIIGRYGRVRGTTFEVGKGRYSAVVLPPGTENLEKATWKLLKCFIKAGGKVFAYSVPTCLDGADCPELAGWFDSAVHPGVVLSSDPAELLSYAVRDGGFSISEIKSRDLFHHRRIYDDGQMLFLSNASLERNASATVAMEGDYLYILDAMTGKIALAKEGKDGVIRFKLTLPPAGSALYFATASPLPENLLGEVDKVFLKGTPVDGGSPVTVSRLHPNSLTLDFCSFNVDGHQSGLLYTKEACGRLFGHFGMADPWERAVQYKKEIIERDTLTTGETTVEYAFSIGRGVDFGGMKALVERPDIWDVSVNGRNVPCEGASELDRRIGSFDIGGLLHEGENVISLHVPRMSLLAEIAPVIIQGNFSVIPEESGWSIAPASDLQPGGWRKQGLPEYAWEVSYSRGWNITDLSRSYFLQLGEWTGTTCQVLVNGEKAGIVPFKPGRLLLKNGLREGENTIEVRVCGSLRNVYGPHYNSITTGVGPGQWNKVASRASGEDYFLIDYGLKDGFELLSF